MATNASTVAHNENIHILRGKGIGGVKADLPKAEKKDRKHKKVLEDHSKPAKNSSRHGVKTMKKAQISNLLTDEEIKKCNEWAKEGIEEAHYTSYDIHKREKDAIDKCVNEEVDMVLSSMGEWNKILYDYRTPVKKIDDDFEKIEMLEYVPAIYRRSPTISPTSGFSY